MADDWKSEREKSGGKIHTSIDSCIKLEIRRDGGMLLQFASRTKEKNIDGYWMTRYIKIGTKGLPETTRNHVVVDKSLEDGFPRTSPHESPRSRGKGRNKDKEQSWVSIRDEKIVGSVWGWEGGGRQNSLEGYSSILSFGVVSASFLLMVHQESWPYVKTPLGRSWKYPPPPPSLVSPPRDRATVQLPTVFFFSLTLELLPSQQRLDLLSCRTLSFALPSHRGKSYTITSDGLLKIDLEKKKRKSSTWISFPFSLSSSSPNWTTLYCLFRFFFPFLDPMHFNIVTPSKLSLSFSLSLSIVKCLVQMKCVMYKCENNM